MRSELSPVRRGSWLEAWEFARPAYTELAFQAIFAVRQGNLPPSVPPNELARTARRRVLQSKVLISVLLGMVSVGLIVIMNPFVQKLFVVLMPRGLYVAAVLAAILVLELTLIWWTGLQVLPAYLSSGIVPLLASLPVDDRTRGRVALLLLLRLFDAPALTCLVLTPIAVGIALNSAVAGILAVPGVLAAVVFAISLSLVTGRFFVRKVQGAQGGGTATVVRWVYLVLWTIPAFTMYGFLTIAPAFLRYVAGLVIDGPSATLNVLFLAFPFPYATLPSYGAGLSTSGDVYGLSPAAIAVGALAYTGFLALTLGWLRGAPLRLAAETPQQAAAAAMLPIRIRTGAVAGAVLRKDVRTASRTPGFAFLILLPLLDAAALGIWTFISVPAKINAFGLAVAAVVSSALLATFFGPAFFAIEVMGYSYTRTLPLPERSVLRGKVALVGSIYAIAAGLVVSLTLLRVFSPILFIGFVAAEFPAILAAAVLEIGILFRRARTTGLPITNLYAGAWWAAMVSVPGLIVAGAPIIVYDLLGGTSLSSWSIPIMGLVALAEFAACAPYAFGTGRGVDG